MRLGLRDGFFDAKLDHFSQGEMGQRVLSQPHI